MLDHPYRRQPAPAFWSRSVSRNYSPTSVAAASSESFLFADDLVASAGSCFASNMVPWLESAGLTYVRAEPPHPALAYLPENLGYRNFSAAYGNIYTARHFRQLIERAYGLFRPEEDRWYDGGRVLDPFRPGLRYPATSDAEFDRLTAQHLSAVRAAMESATVLVFTLGLTEAWESSVDGSVYPACPGTAGGVFDPSKHRFVNFTATEIREDFSAALGLIRLRNPGLRVIVTVSPVPLVATATDSHVLVASTYSKSVLRVAAAEIVASQDQALYFPAYEIITGPQAPEDYFAKDRRNVTESGIAAAMTALFENSQVDGIRGPRTPSPRTAGPSGLPTAQSSAVGAQPGGVASDLSRLIAEAECDEVLADF